MNEELRKRIRDFNLKAKQAEADGYTVADGYVWDGWGNPTGPCARKVCKVEDYGIQCQWHIEGDERTYSKPEILEQYTRDYLAGNLDEGEM